MDSIPQKQCSKCREWKPRIIDNFYKRKDCTDGFAGVCKACLTNDRRARTGAKPRHFLLHDGKKECCICRKLLLATTEYFYPNKTGSGGLSSECRECAKNKGKIYYQGHSEIVKARVKLRRDSDPVTYRESRRLRYQDNPEPIKTRVANWKKTHPEALKAQLQRRKAKKRAAGGSFTGEELKTQYKSQRGLCWWCGYAVGNTYHIDHRIAIDRGGTNDIRNIVISCANCNLRKNNKTPWEWAGRLL